MNGHAGACSHPPPVYRAIFAKPTRSANGPCRTLRLTDRRDRLLLAGFAVALITAFDRTIAFLLQLATEVEASYGVRLVPALVVLTVIFIVHQHSKRQEMRSEAARVAREGQVAHERAEELERLSAFGQALAGALTVDAIQAALWRHLPSFIGERESGSRCGIAASATSSSTSPSPPVTAAMWTTWSFGPSARLRPLVTGDGWSRGRLPASRLITGDAFIGAWGISETAGALGEAAERTMHAAATMLAISLRNVQLFGDLRETALKDALTQCFNRAHLLEVLNAELRRSRRTHNPLSLLMLDLDNFKGLNDRRGHLAGDAALAAIGRQLRSILRQSDVCCRFGGDEFAILLPDTGLRGAAHVADNLRGEIERLQISGGGGEGITASVGVAATLTGEGEPSALVSAPTTRCMRPSARAATACALTAPPSSPRTSRSTALRGSPLTQPSRLWDNQVSLVGA